MSLKVKGIFNLYANYCPTTCINRSCGEHFKNPICPCTVIRIQIYWILISWQEILLHKFSTVSVVNSSQRSGYFYYSYCLEYFNKYELQQNLIYMSISTKIASTIAYQQVIVIPVLLHILIYSSPWGTACRCSEGGCWSTYQPARCGESTPRITQRGTRFTQATQTTQWSM